MLTCQLFGYLQEPGGNELETFLLETADDLSGQMTLDAVRLYDYQSPLCHLCILICACSE
jgi:hypothetical protein